MLSFDALLSCLGRQSRRRLIYVFLVVIFTLILLLYRRVLQRRGLSINQLDTAEQELVALIRRRYLVPPSNLPYSLQEPDTEDPSRGQTKPILDALSSQKNGFFVECGALDGETRSNTLYMERFLGWQGLLIEADPSNFELLRNKHRRAWSVNACLNGKNSRTKARFKPHFNIGRLAEIVWDDEDASKQTLVEVDCFPLVAILLALNRTQIDYFSLDVEGAELDVVRHIPFDRLDIRTLSVEFFHTTGGGKMELRRFLEGKGYSVIDEVNQPDNTAHDFIMVKNSAFPELVEKVQQYGSISSATSEDWT